MAKRGAVRKGGGDSRKARAYVRQGTLQEVGVTGLRHFAGFVREEFLPELQGQRGMKVYREMRDNSAVVGACLGAIDMLMRQVGWHVDPASQSPEDLQRAAFVEQCRQDMSTTWADTVTEHLTMLPFGWALCELVYKKRGGDQNDPARRSKYSDGLIGWRKIPLRSQETLYKWDFDDTGGVQAMLQQAPPMYDIRTIPIEKSLLFRAKVEKNNPEGRSILRNAYWSWYFGKRISEIEAIAVERDLNGLPAIGVPPELLSAGATPEQKAALEEWKAVGRNIRMDEQACIVYPLVYHETHPMPLYKIELLGSSGRRQHDTLAIRQAYERSAAGTMLYDLMLMGAPNTMLYKGNNTPQLFTIALGGWLDAVADIYNAHGIPRLFRLNGWPTETTPKLAHGDVQSPNLGVLGDFLSKLLTAGALTNDPGLEQHLRRVSGLPPRQTDPNAPAAPQEAGPDDGPGPDDLDEAPGGGGGDGMTDDQVQAVVRKVILEGRGLTGADLVEIIRKTVEATRAA